MPPVKKLRTISRPYLPPAAPGMVNTPKSLFVTPELPIQLRFLYFYLLSHEQEDGHFPTQEVLAQDMRCSTRSIVRYMKQLRKLGLVVEVDEDE